LGKSKTFWAGSEKLEGDIHNTIIGRGYPQYNTQRGVNDDDNKEEEEDGKE
jgi:hypothetical protein